MPRSVQSSLLEILTRRVPNHLCPYLGVQHLWACGNGPECRKHPWRRVCPEHEEDLCERRAYRPRASSFQGMPTDAELERG